MSIWQWLLCTILATTGCGASHIGLSDNFTNIAVELMATLPGRPNCLLQKQTQSGTRHSKQTEADRSQGTVGEDSDMIRRTINITCSVDGDEGPWNWTKFQEVTNSLAAAHSGFYIGLTVVCSQGGSVVMERPHQGSLLRSLSILGCAIHSYNVLNPTMVIKQNDLKSLALENCILFIRLSEILEEIKKHHAPDCFINPQLAYYRQHNLSAIHKMDAKLTLNDSIPLKHYQQRNCHCPELHYLELSGHVAYEDKDDSYINLFFPAQRIRPLFPNLKVLVLTRNNLKTVPYHLYTGKWWSHFGALEKIDLSRNQITSLPFRNKQPNMTNPRLFVDLNNNAIESITSYEIRGLGEFWPNYVSLASNPIVCNCSMYDAVTFLTNMDHPRNYIYERLGSSIECAYPVNLTGVTLIDLTEYTACDDEFGYVVFEQRSSLTASSVESNKYIAVICGVVVGQTLMIALVLWYRKRCKLVSAVTVSYQSPSESVDSKMYDAFISYSSLDETWVMGQLYTFLESKAFHVCLHHKDFIPGACISENIINSIDKSRHTILVLSPNFLGSEWCLLEFRKAFQQTLIEKTGHLIVVVKESVDLVSLENDMRHFIQTHTYLSLSDSQFWDKLSRSLT